MTRPVGTVLKYINYPHGKDGIVKDYWFLIMGRTSRLNDPILYYLSKTTTQRQYYEKGGARIRHNFKFLPKERYALFDQDCYMDLDFPVIDKHSVDEVEENIKAGLIQIMGRLDENTMKELYALAIKSHGIPNKVKNDLHSSFNMDGIQGLQRPRQHLKMLC